MDQTGSPKSKVAILERRFFSTVCSLFRAEAWGWWVGVRRSPNSQVDITGTSISMRRQGQVSSKCVRIWIVLRLAA